MGLGKWGVMNELGHAEGWGGMRTTKGFTFTIEFFSLNHWGDRGGVGAAKGGWGKGKGRSLF